MVVFSQNLYPIRNLLHTIMAHIQGGQKIIPFLWFDNDAEEAVKFYTSVFRKSKITDTLQYGDAGPGPKGTIMSVNFQLEGQDFIALNGGPQFKFSPAISFFIKCETQAEVDRFWERLSDGGERLPCGWLKDKFGISWQVVPAILGVLLRDKDPARSQRVMTAMLGMYKIDIAALERAYKGKGPATSLSGPA